MGFMSSLAHLRETVEVKAEALILHISEERCAHLRRLLGEDVGLITHIELDEQSGRFFNVDAPVRVLHKMRDADLLRDDPDPLPHCTLT